ncbi:chorismate-binding protein [Shigella flexneri]
MITTPTLWHLATPFEGKANSQENALTLACLLHPTPALATFPASGRDQGFCRTGAVRPRTVGGIVGWCDSEGKMGEWVVTIRLAKPGKSGASGCGAGLCLRRHRWVSRANRRQTFYHVERFSIPLRSKIAFHSPAGRKSLPVAIGKKATGRICH